METNNNHHRSIFSIRAIVLIGLVVLIVAGGILYFSRSRIVQPHSQPHLNVPASSKNAMFGFDLQRTHFNQSERIINTTNVSHLIPYWSTSTAAYINSSPTEANGMVYIGSNGVVYVGSNDNVLYALNAKTGKVLWTYTTDNFVSSSPAVVNGVVYVGSEDDKLYALNARNGK